MPADTLKPRTAECSLYAALAALWALAAFGPHVAGPLRPHDFADHRMLWGIPQALDVLSNLPFALFGLLGLFQLVRCGRAAAVLPATRIAMAGLFFVGLLLTAAGSSLYHWEPHDFTLLADRAGMAVAFAGLLALAVEDRIGARPAWIVAAAVLVGGWYSLRAWGVDGDLLPWRVLQFGGMLVVVALAVVLRSRWGLPLLAVIGWYALAKLLEAGDHAVFAATGGIVSGHSLKHVAAACAAWPVVATFARVAQPSAAGTIAAEPFHRRSKA